MKKLTFILLVSMCLGLLSSCQKGENFFHGTWQAISEYEYRDDEQGWLSDICTFEMRIDKKSDRIDLSFDYPKEPTDNESYQGTYKYYNDNAIAFTLLDPDMEGVWILQRIDDKLFMADAGLWFTKIKK